MARGYVLGADVGGTRTTVALATAGEPWPAVAAQRAYRSREFAGLRALVESFLAQSEVAPHRAAVRALVDRALEARNRGKFVIDLKSITDTDGNEWLRTAAILLPKDRVMLDEGGKVLSGITDVIGYASWGSNAVDPFCLSSVGMVDGSVLDSVVCNY